MVAGEILLVLAVIVIAILALGEAIHRSTRR